MNVLILIPARYASTRFPGKPLAEIGGKPMIQHVVEKAQLVSQDAFVATDDQRIYDRVVGFGGKVVMTSADHKSGTDRCCEAYRHIVADYRKTYDVVVNIQGDEPFIQPDQVRALKIPGFRSLPWQNNSTRMRIFSIPIRLRWYVRLCRPLFIFPVLPFLIAGEKSKENGVL